MKQTDDSNYKIFLKLGKSITGDSFDPLLRQHTFINRHCIIPSTTTLEIEGRIIDANFNDFIKFTINEN